MPFSTLAIASVFLAAALAAGLSWIAARRTGPESAGPWWGALAVGLAYVIGHLGVATPSLRFADVTDRIPLLALAGAAVAVTLNGKRGVLWARLLGYLGLAALAYFVMLGPVLGPEDFPSDKHITPSVIAVVLILATINVALLDAPSRRSELWTALTALSLGSGVVLVLAYNAVLFQLGGVVAVCLAASILVAWGRPIGGGIAVAWTVLTALVVEGAVYAYLPPLGAGLLAAAPAGLWLLRVPALAGLGPRVRSALAVGLVLIPVAAAIGLTLASRSPDGYGS